MRKLKCMLAAFLAVALVVGLPGQAISAVSEQLEYVHKHYWHSHEWEEPAHEDENFQEAVSQMKKWLPAGVIIAHADSTQDGDSQFIQSGNDTDAYNKAVPGAFGCWRLYLAKYADGTVVSRTTDCGPMSMPPEMLAAPFVGYGTGTKIRTMSGSLSYGQGGYTPLVVENLPNLGASQAE